MNYFKYLIISCLFISNLIAQEKIILNDNYIKTNLIDNLNTPILIKKSSNLNVERLNKLSRLTDLKIQTKKLSINKLAVSEIIEAPKIIIDNSDFYFYKNKLINPINSIDIFIQDLNTEFNTVSILNVVQVAKIDMQVFSIKNCELYNDCIVNNLDIDNTVYVIDQSNFTVQITDDILKQLNIDTDVYNFSKKYTSYNNAYLKDFSLLSLEQKTKWINIFNQNKDSTIEYIKPLKTPKIISEARIENDIYSDNQKNRLLDNLKILKAMGYDSVLVRFYVDQNLDLIVKLLNDIKSTKMDIYVTYVGLDNRKPISWNPFVEPDILEKYIETIAPYATGWFLNWRSTSQHTKLLPKEFFDYLCNTVRKYNDKCYIYGEIYYGQIDPLRKIALMYNIPKNVSGVIINNMGFYGYNHAFIVNRLFNKAIPNYKNLSKIAQVIGYRPYYASKNNMHLNLVEEYSYKQKIENNFKRVKCGTVTLLHDGVDDNFAENYLTYETQDNIVEEFKIKLLNN